MLVLSLVRTLLFVAAHGGTIMKAARVGLLVSGLLAAWAMPAHAGQGNPRLNASHARSAITPMCIPRAITSALAIPNFLGTEKSPAC